MKPKIVNIEDEARANEWFRREIVTGEHSQVFVMSLNPGEDVGEETHTPDQTLTFVEGIGNAVLNDEKFEIEPGMLVFVPAGTKHNFINTDSIKMKLYTVYAPNEHKAGTNHETKEEALEDPNEQHES